MSETQLSEDSLEKLRAEDIVTIDEADDTVATTEAFEADRQVYYDTYLGVGDQEFYESVADVFGLESAATAAERIETLDISREEFATFLALRSAVDAEYNQSELTRMAQMAAEVGPSTPVPDAVNHLDDDSFPAFINTDRAVVTVWKLFCDPCDAMKAEMDNVLDAFPEDVAVGGLDGEQCPDFCKTVGVNAAPAVVFFEDGEAVEVVTGRTDPDKLAARVQEVYGV